MLFLINYFKEYFLKSAFYSIFILVCLCFFFHYLHYAKNWEVMLFVWISCLWFTDFFNFQVKFISSIVIFIFIFSLPFFFIFNFFTDRPNWGDVFFLENYLVYVVNNLIATTPIFINVGLKKMIEFFKKKYLKKNVSKE